MTEDAVRALLSIEGQESLAQNLGYTAQDFVLGRGKEYSEELRQGIAEQLLCQKSLVKLPAFQKAGAIVEKDLLEQATPEPVARFRSTLMSGKSCCELTGGMGSDTLFLSPKFMDYTFCEISQSRALLFQYNKKLLSLNHVTVVAEDSIAFLQANPQSYDWIFADPARRSDGKKGRIALADCLPNILENEKLIASRCTNFAIKVSPAYDITQLRKELPWISKIYALSYKREMREIFAFGNPSVKSIDAEVFAIGLSSSGESDFSFTSMNPIKNVSISEEVEGYLYEPDPAIIKAALVDQCASVYNLQRVSAEGVFLRSSEYIVNFPGRTFLIKTVVDWQRKSVGQYLKQNMIHKASVMRRDFPVSAEELKKRFKLSESETSALLFTTLRKKRRVMIHLERVYPS